jgi:ribose 5-phosphate isomerase RpiB
MIVEAWLEAGYQGGRHARRVEMIAEIEAEAKAGWRA